MEYRKLGLTDMDVSILSFGASSLGGVFHSIDEKEGRKAVWSALDNGINFIDVAPYYGFCKAEEVLGKALKEVNRERYFLSTKVGRYGQNGQKKWDYSAAKANISVDESLKRLNIDYIDLINVHDIEFANLSQVINETLPALYNLKKAGKVRYVGITGLPLPKLKYVVENSEEKSIDSILSFCHYCLNDDALLEYVDFFKTHQVGIINASPLSMGLLTQRGAPDWHPASDQLKHFCRKAVAHCKTKKYPIEQLAVKYSVANPEITTTLVSTASSENMLKNIRWAETAQNDTLLQEVLEILKPVHNETWENS